jgi:hypothetical protein
MLIDVEIAGTSLDGMQQKIALWSEFWAYHRFYEKVKKVKADVAP